MAHFPDDARRHISIRGVVRLLSGRRRRSEGVVVRAIVLAVLVMVPVFRATASDRPNILFIIADDHTHAAIGAMGLTDIDTPNLDRLVKRGTTFTHAYNMGSFSQAVCVASRAMLMTGRSVWRAAAVYDEMDQERSAGRLWPQRMEKAGYETFFTGKWHVTTDAAKVFGVTRHIREGMPKDTPDGYNRPLDGQRDQWDPSNPKFGGFWQGGQHWSEVLADDAVEFIQLAQRSTKPTFIYAAFNAPHDPRQSPRNYIQKYPLIRIELPISFLPVYPHHEAIGCGPTLRDEKLAPFPRTPHAVKVHRQEYYAAISYMDSQIGRMLDAVEQSGQADKTWIIYTADHGLAVGQHGLMGKQNMYEHSLRVPFIVCGPGVAAGSRIDTPIYMQDAMATCLAIAESPLDDRIEFRSLLPLLRDGDASTVNRDAIYAAYLGLQRAVIQDGWKLICYPKAQVTRLYNVRNDPHEFHDFANDRMYEKRKRSLFRELQQLQVGFDDSLDLTMAFPDL